MAMINLKDKESIFLIIQRVEVNFFIKELFSKENSMVLEKYVKQLMTNKECIFTKDIGNIVKNKVKEERTIIFKIIFIIEVGLLMINVME
jgi:hypothetical protein